MRAGRAAASGAAARPSLSVTHIFTNACRKGTHACSRAWESSWRCETGRENSRILEANLAFILNLSVGRITLPRGAFRSKPPEQWLFGFERSVRRTRCRSSGSMLSVSRIWAYETTGRVLRKTESTAHWTVSIVIVALHLGRLSWIVTPQRGR